MIVNATMPPNSLSRKQCTFLSLSQQRFPFEAILCVLSKIMIAEDP